jgi:hypothetical protein
MTEEKERMPIDHDVDTVRTVFTLSVSATAEWERLERRRARDLPGLRRLMKRPWPFST